jgi:hypothetical protein
MNVPPWPVMARSSRAMTGKWANPGQGGMLMPQNDL